MYKHKVKYELDWQRRWYVHIPPGVKITNDYNLKGPLGLCYPYLGDIRLNPAFNSGKGGSEILYHEVEHFRNPGASERQVRNTVVETLPFDPVYHP